MTKITSLILGLLISVNIYATDCPPAGEKHKYLDTPLDINNPSIGTYKLHYKLQNSFNENKKTLILLHGGPGGDIKSFDQCPGGYCFKELSDQYNIIAVDERGAGCSLTPEWSNDKYTTIQSTANDIEYLRRYLVGKDKKISVFGVSFGTVVGVVLASTYPESIERLILEGSLANNTYQENLPDTINEVTQAFYITHPEAKKLNDIVEERAQNGELEITFEDYQGLRDAFAMYGYKLLYHAFPAMLEELFNNKYDLYHTISNAFTGEMGHVPQTSAYQYIMCREIVDFNATPNRFTTSVQNICEDFREVNPNFTKWNALDYTPNITTPTLILTGISDAVTAAYNGEILDNNIHDSSFFVVPKAGHGVLWENPTCDLALIDEFLENGNSNELETIFNSNKCR